MDKFHYWDNQADRFEKQAVNLEYSAVSHASYESKRMLLAQAAKCREFALKAREYAAAALPNPSAGPYR